MAEGNYKQAAIAGAGVLVGAAVPFIGAAAIKAIGKARGGMAAVGSVALDTNAVIAAVEQGQFISETLVSPPERCGKGFRS